MTRLFLTKSDARPYETPMAIPLASSPLVRVRVGVRVGVRGRVRVHLEAEDIDVA